MLFVPVTVIETMPLTPAVKVMFVVPCPAVMVPFTMAQVYVATPPMAPTEAWLPVEPAQTPGGRVIGRIAGGGGMQMMVKEARPEKPLLSCAKMFAGPRPLPVKLNVCTTLSAAVNE